MADDFDTRNKAAWASAVRALFGTSPIPQSAQWANVDDIVCVLTLFAKEGLNHTLLPTGGGLDMGGIAPSSEKDCIAFSLSPSTQLANICCPQTLFFEYFPESPWNSFFLLETKILPPSEVNEPSQYQEEEVVELPSGQYLPRFHFDNGHLGHDENGDEIPLPKGTKLVSRYLSGKFIVVAKRSIWNRIHGTYDARHNHMTSAQIRERIQCVIDQVLE